jgi:hypothetical protein
MREVWEEEGCASDQVVGEIQPEASAQLALIQLSSSEATCLSRGGREAG